MLQREVCDLRNARIEARGASWKRASAADTKSCKSACASDAYSCAALSALRSAKRKQSFIAATGSRTRRRAWGATAHVVMAVAPHRGWQCNGSCQLLGSIGNVYRQARDAEITGLSRIISALHLSSFNIWQRQIQAQDGVNRERDLVKKLEPLEACAGARARLDQHTRQGVCHRPGRALCRGGHVEFTGVEGLDHGAG